MSRPNKYGAQTAQCRANHRHASRKEARRCDELHLLLRAGDIEDLEQQPRFYFVINGQQVKHGNGRRLVFTPDFKFIDRHSGKTIVEDAKGMRTEAYVLRATLFRALFPDLVFREV
jgi:hypothetical protein